MKKMRRKIKIFSAAVITVMLLSTFTVLGSSSNNDRPYDGHLRIYIAEIESRWDMYDGNPYHYALMDIAYDDVLSIDYLGIYTDSITWSGDVTEENIIVFAAVFNPVSFEKLSFPPLSRGPFDAYYVDAATGAHPGETNYNIVNEDFTHTVFIEEGTGTWCKACPDMAYVLYDIYNSGDYPFYYVALVEDKNEKANERLVEDYNIFGYPAGFLDGGSEVIVGGGASEETFREGIQTCGAKDVHSLDLALSVSWTGKGSMQIDFNITNNEKIHYPDKPATPTGPVNGSRRESYQYCTSTEDPEGDDVYYKWDWGNGDVSGWMGPFGSGEVMCTSHTWPKYGTYEIRVRAKDANEEVGSWSDPLPVTMPRNKAINIPFLNFLQNILNSHPNLFPILQRLLKL